MIRITLIILLSLSSLGLIAQTEVTHKPFDELLQKHVDSEGMVNYKGFLQDRKKLSLYLNMLESNSPKGNWTRDQRLAYWINAYNAYTIELILRHYPVQSIKDIGSLIKIPFVSTAWDVKFISIAGQEMDLNNIEHGIIRKEFDEPRIHFALVCAAMSCPKLQNSAYFPERLDEQLNNAGSEFLADPSKNEFKSSKQANLSKLFDWYGGDFKTEGTLVQYINQYAPIQLNSNAKIDWLNYDWSLNEQQ